MRLIHLLGAALAAALLVEAARFAHGWLDHRRAAGVVFARATADRFRPFEPRLAYARADRHRPIGSAPRADLAAAASHGELARLERAGDLQGVAAAYALAGDRARAERLLAGLPPSPEVDNDLGALAAETPGRESEALTRLERVLARRPDHPQALFNRGLVLARLGLDRAAEKSLRAAAALGEPGWSEEAAARAERLATARRQRKEAFARAEAAAAKLKDGVVPPREILVRHPDLFRAELYRLLREEAASPGRLLPVARAIDREQGGRSAEFLLGGTVDLVKMAALSKDPLSVPRAEEYRRLAAQTGDPWQEIRGWQALAGAREIAGDPVGATQAFDRALALCRERHFPQLCIFARLRYASFAATQHQNAKALALARAGKDEAAVHALPALELGANDQLQRVSAMRKDRTLARAYAEENALAEESCVRARTAREYLAQLASEQWDHREAQRQLEAIIACDNGPRLVGQIGLSVLGELVRDPTRSFPGGWAWFEASAAAVAKQPLNPLDRLRLERNQARALIVRDRARAVALLERIAARTEVGAAGGDEAAENVRRQVLVTLAVDAAANGEHARLLALLGRNRRVSPPRACVAGLAADSLRRGYVACDERGLCAGEYRELVGFRPDNAPEALPASLAQRLAGCAQVLVLATQPLNGRSRLLPQEMAWSFLERGDAAPVPKGPVMRLVVADAQPPLELGLPRLAGRWRPEVEPEGDTVVALTGAEATPAKVLAHAQAADAIELHVHGIVAPDISDTAALVLSPEPDARNRAASILDSRQIERLRLDRRPAVTLGACHGGKVAFYGAFELALPTAFLRAGARWVIASTAPIEDGEAAEFFASVWRRVRTGDAPAIAVRDERLARRVHSSHWTGDVVVFQ